MNNQTKKQINFRLKDAVIKELQSLAVRRRLSQADIVAILIHWFYTDAEDIEKLEEAFDTAATI